MGRGPTVTHAQDLWGLCRTSHPAALTSSFRFFS
nr:MAG TPA: hypothetical protein [Caudoviricetes sp.]